LRLGAADVWTGGTAGWSNRSEAASVSLPGGSAYAAAIAGGRNGVGAVNDFWVLPADTGSSCVGVDVASKASPSLRALAVVAVGDARPDARYLCNCRCRRVWVRARAADGSCVVAAL
jgi:hypothetical protein